MSSGSIVQFPLEDEYKKDTGINPEDVKILRDWMDIQPHLPGKYVTDLELILAYHSCDRDLEKSKQLIDTHYTLRTKLTLLFKDRVIDDKIEKALNTLMIIPLPIRTKEGYAVFYSRMLDFDPQNFVHIDTLRALVMRWDIWQHEEGTWPGIVMVSDAYGATFGHMYRMSFSGQQQISKFFQEGLLAKLKQIHVVNAPAFVDKMLAMCKPFLYQSVIDMMHIHRTGAISGLEEFLPVEALPLEAGGKWKSLDECKEETLAKFRASADFFKEESRKRVDEAKRPIKPSTGFFRSFFS